MSTQSLAQAIEAASTVLAGVRADQLEDPTPCASWNVGEVINHMVGGMRFFTAGLAGEAPPESEDATSGDFVAAYDEAAGAALAAFSADGVLESTVKMPFGEMPGAAVLGLATTDTFTHAWDLAKATGQSTDLAPELATQLLAQSRQMIQPAFRGQDGQAPFGAEQECPDGASAADQLAAFLGRRV